METLDRKAVPRSKWRETTIVVQMGRGRPRHPFVLRILGSFHLPYSKKPCQYFLLTRTSLCTPRVWTYQELSEGNEEVNTRRHRTSQDDRNDLGAVCRRHCPVKAERVPVDEFSGEQETVGVCKELNEDSADRERACTPERPAPTNRISDVATANRAKESADRRDGIESSLPFRRKNGLTGRIDVAKALSELRKG